MNYVLYTMHYTKVFVGVIQYIQASLSCIQYAVWDLAFHMIPFARIDPEFAKKQLELFLSEKYMAPNGQIPGKNQQYNCHIACLLPICSRENRGRPQTSYNCVCWVIVIFLSKFTRENLPNWFSFITLSCSGW